MSDVSIRLSLEDLRALFGGDDPPSIEFRNGIANKFAEQHLKSLVSSQIMQQCDGAVAKEVRKILEESVFDDSYWQGSTNKRLQAHYRNLILVTIDTEITKIIEDKLKLTILEEIDKALDKNNISKLVERIISDRIGVSAKTILSSLTPGME